MNSEEFFKSFRKNQVVGLRIYDPRSKADKGKSTYKEKVNLRRALFRYGEVSVFYIGLILISIGFGLYFLLNPTKVPCP